MFNSSGWKPAICSLALFVLVACDSAEERAEGHFESGVALIEAGDVERGIVELRNVLSLNQFHSDARKLYAAVLREQGDFAQSYGEYRYLVEADPNDFDSRMALAEMSAEVQNWTEFDRQKEALLQANVDLDGIDLIDYVGRFRSAALAEDVDALERLLVEGEELSVKMPDDITLRKLLVEGYYISGRLESALPHMDALIALDPQDPTYYMMKARALAELEELVELEDLLLTTVSRFPEETDARVALLRLYAREGRTERAEEFLRDVAARTNEQSDIVTLIAYLRRVEGSEAARKEIEERLSAAPEATFLIALKAGILFDEGERDDAIALMEGITNSDVADAQTNRYKISLAKMLLATGNEVGARQLVEDVLNTDGSQVEALKMSATWLIEDDRPEEAIGQLRIALDQEPDDPETMTMMSSAHMRMGDREVAQDLLSLAVEASDNAPAESIRFAEFLISEGSFRPAEDVLLSALRNDTRNTQILVLLGDIYLETAEWNRGQQVVGALRRINTPEANQTADDLQSRVIAGRQGGEQAIAYLENLIENEDGADGLRLSLLRSLLDEGETDEALRLIDELTAEFPNNPRLRYLKGNTLFATRDYASATVIFEAFVEEFPNSEQAWVQLSRSLGAQGERTKARDAIDRGLEANPDAPNILWAKASYLEADRDIDGAIAIYEKLYEQNSASPIVANNLASLLATYREDEESLERAYTVGRRLRGTEVAPFQDTYGWILHRRGDFEEALTYLEPAARSLSDDPIVQYHLAMTYLELGRSEAAKTSFERVLEIAEPDDPRPQIGRAAAELERLTSLLATE